MKSKTIHTNKKLNKKVLIALAVLGIAGIGTIVATQARRNILDGTVPFSEKTEFRVLEIVPTNANDANEEIGYFVSDNGGSATDAGKADFKDVSVAKSLGGRSETDVNAPLYNEQLENFLKLREYGLVKYEGIDRGIYNVDVSEYPVYSKQANFVKKATAGYRLLNNQYVLGKYVTTDASNGSYFLKDGYTVSSNGLIYQEVTREITVEVPVDPTVSDNSTVSGNTTTTETTTITEYIPISAGNPDNKQLPEAVEQRFDSDGELIMTGDVNFVMDESGVYYGFTSDAYYVYEKPDLDNNAFHNGDWFKEYVLGDRASGQNVVVDTVAANAVTADMIGSVGDEKYDLIYISGTYDAYQSSAVDLTEAVVMDLYNMASLPEYQAVMMDYKLLGPTSGTSPSNIEKLALLLWQKDQRAILSMSTDGLADTDKFTVEDDKVTGLPETTSTTWSILGANMGDTPGLSTGNFVAGSVYVYDHKREYFTDSKVQVDAGDFFANGDFASSYTTGVVASGLTAVKVSIQMNNINHADKKVSEAVTPAAVIQYILSYDGTNPSLVKTELNVLEIQPVRAFRYNSYWGTTAYSDCDDLIKGNREQFISDFLDEKFEDDPTLVSFTSMTIEEFIGRIEDINEKYDLIYIGSETSHQLKSTSSSGRVSYTYMDYYHKTSGYSRTFTQDASGNIVMDSEAQVELTAFNDMANMCGMVYYNIGDIFYIGTRRNYQNGIDSLLGIIDDGSVYGSVNYSAKEGKSKGRFSGRDLTEDKLKDMKEFLDAGYPVIVAGDIVRCVPTSTTTTGLTKVINPTEYKGTKSVLERDHGRVDNSSKLYEFLKYAVYGGTVTSDDGSSYFSGSKENLISEADVQAGLVNKKDISEYLNKPKLSINLTSRPVEYSYSTENVQGGESGSSSTVAVIDEQTKLSPDPVTGKFNLDYEFTITNAGALGSASGTYNVHLYVDVNADGKFSEQEELKDCKVTNAVTGVEIPSTTTLDGKSFSLQADVLYKLHREVPEGYSGILPWKVEVVMEDNVLVRASEQGYTQVPRATEEKITINIMQVNNNSSTLNLQNQLANPTGNGYYFGVYLSQLKDYNVVVKTVSQTQFQNSAYKDLDNYDMLILGFGDCYDAFTNRTAVEKIISYIESGKPVLLTHDLLMFRAGAMQTKMLRNYVGMDRYGCYDSTVQYNGTQVLRTAVMYTRAANSEIVKLIENSGHRVVYLPGSNKDTLDWTTQGVSNLTMVRYRNDDRSYSASKERRYIANHYGINNVACGAWLDQKTYVVQNINEGQITTYPYVLPSSFNVATTHNQYYQLDMEGDMDDDGETDIVVWYTLGNLFDGTKEADGGYVKDGSEYNFTPNDVVNNYYIYNKGNVTYSGVGHSKPASKESQKYEAQLFVNTMIAAYRAGTRAPGITFYESEKDDAAEIMSLPVVYDKNVGKNAESGDAESSVLKLEDGTFKNEFVDTGDQSTKLYFELSDENLVRGTKGIKLKFYIEDAAGTEEITIVDSDGNPKTVKATSIPLTVYNSDFTHAYTNHVASSSGVADPDKDEDCMLQTATRYGIELPLSKLKTQGELKLYVSAQTTIYNKTVSNSVVTQESPESFTEFSVIKMDLLNLD